MTWQPAREIELVAGTPAGGGQDRPARALMRVIATMGLVPSGLRLTNIPGRGGGNGWDYLAQHPGDPHRIAISSPTLITNRLLGVATLDDGDLTPLATLYTEYIAFVVRADSPLREGDGLLRALARPATLTIALATARGNTNHIALARCVRAAGGEPCALPLHVFDSAPDAVADVRAGHADVGAITAISAAREIASGALRALAVSAPARLPGALGCVPTWREQGVDCVIGTWRGLVGTRGLAPEVIAYWNERLARAVTSPEWQTLLAEHAWLPTLLDSAATRAFLDRERPLLAGALRELELQSA